MKKSGSGTEVDTVVCGDEEGSVVAVCGTDGTRVGRVVCGFIDEEWSVVAICEADLSPPLGFDCMAALVVEPDSKHVLAFWQVPNRPGRQSEQCFPAFTQAHPLHWPVRLHLQQTTMVPIAQYYLVSLES